MQLLNFKNGIIATLCIVILSLLLLNKCNDKSDKAELSPTVSQDTLFLKQWRKERSYKLGLVKYYDGYITQLQKENKQYSQSIKISKLQLSNYRRKTDSITALLTLRPLKKINVKNHREQDSLLSNSSYDFSDTTNQHINLLAELIKYHDSSNVKCDTVINLLEQKSLRQDSIINFQKSNEEILKSFNEEQTLQNTILSNQLNQAYKQQNKKTRQVKILSAGLFLLSGISTSLFLIQYKK